jgi:NAD(P)-dependent dehydrogenase (short-subunit alcohol dehydrogenase family)
MGTLDGKVSLVTGAAGGLGRASALIFAREGVRVIVADIRRDGGEETVKIIKDAGGEATFVAADVSCSADVKAMVRAAVDIYGGLDCAMNNAVRDAGRRPLAEIPEEDWHRTIAVNLTGVFLCMKYEILAMLERGGGAIVNVGSGNEHGAAPGIAYYIAVKHGLQGLTKVAALDYGGRGIRVNAIGPGTMWTPMMREAAKRNPQHLDQLLSMTPTDEEDRGPQGSGRGGSVGCARMRRRTCSATRSLLMAGLCAR